MFARVSPEQKLRLVEGLQARHHVVAMTGDGVNDAPALQQADIGVAMGFGGTEVAKEAADMVLTDDDFATIEAAIEEGRGVFDNLTKFIVWTLPTNMGEGLVILTAIVLGLALPILPVQILWINMTTAVALGLMLAFEPKEAGIMQRPPRDPQRPLLTGTSAHPDHAGLDHARRRSLVALRMGAVQRRHPRGGPHRGAQPVRRRRGLLPVQLPITHPLGVAPRVFSNRWIIGGVTVQALGQLAITYLPFMNNIFQTAPIPGGAWLRILAIAIAASLVVAVDKRLRRHLA